MLTYYLFGNAPASASNSRMEYAEVAELADALDSKSSVYPNVPVRVRPSAPYFISALYSAEVAELADALDSKSSVYPNVPVRVRPSAPVNL